MTARRRGAVPQPGGPAAARTPFVVLVVVLLAGGLIALLVLNTAVNQGSFRLSELQKETTRLTDEEQALQQQVDEHSAPGELARRARELGMVPGGNPAFLDDDGTVRGVPGESGGAPPAVRPPTAAPSPTGSVAPSLGPDTAPAAGAGDGAGPSAQTPAQAAPDAR
ncbi:cell division protein FtsL [Streptomyces sp. NPDC059506]|uniref:Septum formation initiator family protein n=1 Tax=Streptomyces thermolineatus TaxID=44033 RepID=A0ABP5ZUG8_9ACTN|nr:cell division protein FtsL [Streptomyces sp. HB2AG]MCZ2526511.1 cell division protein FtsL [Streptomyces sp. HB2AG]